MGDTNGSVKWWQLVTITVALFGTIMGIFLWGVNAVAFNDRTREKADKEIMECLYTRLGVIDSRLARIEMKIFQQ